MIFEFSHGTDPKPWNVPSTSSSFKARPISNASPVTEYTRELDLGQALQRVSYKCNGVRYIRESFASVPAQVMAFHIEAHNG